MSGNVLGCLELAHGFFDIPGDFIRMNFHRLDHTLGIDDEGAAQSQAFTGDVHVKCIGQCMGRVTHQWKLSLADSRGGVVPDLMGEMRIGGHDDSELGAPPYDAPVYSTTVYVKAVQAPVQPPCWPVRLRARYPGPLRAP